MGDFGTKALFYGGLALLIFLSGMDAMRVIDQNGELKDYKSAIIQRDAIQAELNSKDLKLAEAQRAAHEKKLPVIIKWETKWRDSPAPVQQSCIDSGLFEYTDAVLGTLPRATDSSK